MYNNNNKFIKVFITRSERYIITPEGASFE